MTKFSCLRETHAPAHQLHKRLRRPSTPNLTVVRLAAAILLAAAQASTGVAVDHDISTAQSSEMVGPPVSVHTVQRRQKMMGTWLEVTIWANDRQQAMESSEAAFAAVADTDLRLSTWRDDSELAAANDRGSRTSVEISPLLARDLETALAWSRATYGAFSPGVGSLVTLWDFRGNGRVPTDAELEPALAEASLTGTGIDNGLIVFGQPGLQFEEGGFGKGAALDDALDSALEHGARCVVLDFGGQIAAGGRCDAMAIGISDPNDRQREVAVLSITKGSVATSGLSERHFVLDSVRYGHIIDPRTGSPARDWGSVTVIAHDATAADCVSTALYVMGPESGAKWLSRHPELEAVFSVRTDAGLRLRATAGLVERLTPGKGLVVEWIPGIDARQHGPPVSTTSGY